MARSGLVGRAVDYAEDRLGFRMVEGSHYEALEEASEKLGFFIDEAGELAYSTLDYFSGRPNEMRPERRNRLAARSRRALREDPLARAETDLVANFAFGRGVAKPTAADEKVQEVIDEAWMDPINRTKLTGFEAQRHRSGELKTQANLYPVAFVRNGKVRIGFLDADLVHDVVCDADDDELPLYYVGRKKKVSWNFETHQYEVDERLAEGGVPKTIYWAHWRHVEDRVREAGDDGEKLPEGPEKTDLQEGLVEHVRINRIGRTQFGTPPWAASLRFFSAMNQLTESHVAMAQAKSAWIAKRTVKGGPSAVVSAANAVLSQTGELAASRFGEAPIPGTTRPVSAPPMPGSIWTENESSKLENLNLTSGAGEAATTAQIVRAPIAAAAGFGQHYLGDASNANLATATSLELPALMNVQSWQETFEQMFRWFVDLVIQEAVRGGRLGGLAERPALEESEGAAERLPLSKLRLGEADERAEMEARTGKDLTYTFEMPYPGRRNLPDVVTAVTSLAQSYDPAGVNVPLRRELLYFFARDGLGVDDPKRWVEEILPKDAKMLPGAGIPLGLDAEGKPLPTPPPEPGGPTGAKGPSDAKSQYGERTANPATRTGAMAAGLIEGLSDEELLAIERALDGEWERDVVSPAVAASLAASSNGTGS